MGPETPVRLFGLEGCEGLQSILRTFGASAELIATIAWTLFIGGGLIFLFVFGVAAFLILARPERRRRVAGRGLIVGGGLVFPIVTLTLLLLFTLPIGREAEAICVGEPYRIEVTGKMWWWEVRYPGAPGAPEVITANEVHVPVGLPVEIAVATTDVIHSFWIPSLAGKLDMIPGQVNRLPLLATAPGTFRGQCAEFCGAQHAHMAFYAVAHPPDEFEAWLAAQRLPAREPETPFLQRGRELFLSAGCGGCHAIRGTPAQGTIGPDLTHVGSRLSIGAGMLPNNVGTLAGWIADTQHIKPDANMPSFNIFDGPDLRALAAYLESLK